MRVFDENFNMKSYIQKRLLEIDDLPSRRALKAVLEKLLVNLHEEAEKRYQELEKRVFDEIPMQTEGPAIVTNIIDRKYFDATDAFLLPMRGEDLETPRIDTEELLASLENKRPFFLYTVFLRADYAETCKFDSPRRSFRGVVKTRHSEYPAIFHVRRNVFYKKKIEELYRIFQLNYLPWRSVCAPYLHKLFDVYIDRIENWDSKETIEEAAIDFEEFKPYVRYHQIPLWNLYPVEIKTSTYPEPCVDKTNYEHRVFRHRFDERARYLITNTDIKISNIRWVGGDLLITCPAENPVKWEMYCFNPREEREYPNLAMSNAKQSAFSDRLMGAFNQPVKTKMELTRLLTAFDLGGFLEFVGARLVPNYPDKETYPVDDFILDELRTGGWETAMELQFRPADHDFYLNRDLMSFLAAVAQRHFPEYECCGKLI